MDLASFWFSCFFFLSSSRSTPHTDGKPSPRTLQSRYEGQWKMGKRHGKGGYYYSDGGSYVGDWLDDRIQGKGVSHYSNGNMYEGDWVDQRALPMHVTILGKYKVIVNW